MAVLSTNPKLHLDDINGNPASGYQLFTYVSGTTTKQASYTDSSETVQNSNPIILDERGECDLWLGRDKSYKLVFTDPSDSDPPLSSIWSVDGILGEIVLIPVVKSGNYTITTSDRNKVFLIDASGGNVTLSANASSVLGNGFTFFIKKTDSSSNTVAFDPSGSETVDNLSTFAFTQQYDSAEFVSDGSNWWSLNKSILTVIRDTNLNTVVSTTAVTNPSANNFDISAATAGNSPILSVTGTNSNINLTIKSKGTGGTQFKSATSVNNLIANGSATTVAPTLSAEGSDSNVALGLVTKGTSDVQVNSSDSRTNTVNRALSVNSTTSGSAAASIGTGILVTAKSADENPCQFGALDFIASDITAGSEDTYLSLKERVAGAALAETYAWKATGAFSQTHTHVNTALRTITWPDQDISITNLILSTAYSSTNSAVNIVGTALPLDDTIPQSTEGTQVLTVSITPKNTANFLAIYVNLSFQGAGTATMGVALFQDATANALAAVGSVGASLISSTASLLYKMTAGTTSSTTFKVRIGPSASGGGQSCTLNGVTGGTRIYGGVCTSSILIIETSV